MNSSNSNDSEIVVAMMTPRYSAAEDRNANHSLSADEGETSPQSFRMPVFHRWRQERNPRFPQPRDHNPRMEG